MNCFKRFCIGSKKDPLGVLEDLSFWKIKGRISPFHTLTPYSCGGRSRTDKVFLPSDKLYEIMNFVKNSAVFIKGLLKQMNGMSIIRLSHRSMVSTNEASFFSFNLTFNLPITLFP